MKLRQLAERNSILLSFSRLHNITYRQLNSDITTRKATFDLHRMCELQLFEQKGQKRNAYYVAGQEFIRLNNRVDDDNSRANGEMYRANGEMYGANGEMYRAEQIPEELLEKINKIGKKLASNEMESLILDLCSCQPFSIMELATILQRNIVFLRNHYLKPLIKQGKLFYTIPEMLNHPKQKYTTKKKQ